MTTLDADPSDAAFLNQDVLLAGGPRAFTRAAERLLWTLGFDDVRNIDGPGDAGGDLLASRGGLRWVFQCKWKKSGLVGEDAIREVDAARAFYSADRAVVVTNSVPGQPALAFRRRLLGVGVRVDFWDRTALKKFSKMIPKFTPSRYAPYPYQQEAIAACRNALDDTGRALLVLATGLGKTVVGGEIVRTELERKPDAAILVVAHVKELVSQLEKAMWRHVPKEVRTRTLTGDTDAEPDSGVVCATIQAATSAVAAGWTPDFIVVDEAHHLGDTNTLAMLLDATSHVSQLGLTATPWRGDKYDISARFGAPVFRMGIADGMAEGFLSQVNYRLLVDHIDWTVVSEASQHGLTLRDLNSRLFLPQRDDEIIDELRETWSRIREPRAIVFCRTIGHAEEFAHLLRGAGWRRARCLNTHQTRRERDILMAEFRDGRIPIVTAVDIFNEGVDVPDVNILCFLRVTHSRRIFVQQLGRGLRVRPGKEAVEVLDFVSDIRRVAATLDLRRALEQLAEDDVERVRLAETAFTFSEPTVGSLLDEWIRDAAALEDAADEVRMQFPPTAYDK
jgi:superfamily II DNA or RNA helicase